eukprot:TRINITY_DN2648_c0_g1_i1.p1 TRINITY_DN2648_c0_g1~~TRINITY_DN2648_c0_g1_i1.p1  ORF type:complete len:57 (+),score=3.45 TRINITY_DN2648_c0_g1_i1:429-599(+)
MLASLAKHFTFSKPRFVTIEQFQDRELVHTGKNKFLYGCNLNVGDTRHGPALVRVI